MFTTLLAMSQNGFTGTVENVIKQVADIAITTDTKYEEQTLNSRFIFTSVKIVSAVGNENESMETK